MEKAEETIVEEATDAVKKDTNGIPILTHVLGAVMAGTGFFVGSLIGVPIVGVILGYAAWIKISFNTNVTPISSS